MGAIGGMYRSSKPLPAVAKAAYDSFARFSKYLRQAGLGPGTHAMMDREVGNLGVCLFHIQGETAQVLLEKPTKFQVDVASAWKLTNDEIAVRDSILAGIRSMMLATKSSLAEPYRDLIVEYDGELEMPPGTETPVEEVLERLEAIQVGLREIYHEKRKRGRKRIKDDPRIVKALSGMSERGETCKDIAKSLGVKVREVERTIDRLRKRKRKAEEN